MDCMWPQNIALARFCAHHYEGPLRKNRLINTEAPTAVTTMIRPRGKIRVFGSS
jgi:hypothetical protein